MERLERVISTISNMLDSKQKRQIIGGILLSASLFFGGLAFTTMSIKGGNNE
jgi:hypothetical protein